MAVTIPIQFNQVKPFTREILWSYWEWSLLSSSALWSHRRMQPKYSYGLAIGKAIEEHCLPTIRQALGKQIALLTVLWALLLTKNSASMVYRVCLADYSTRVQNKTYAHEGRQSACGRNGLVTAVLLKHCFFMTTFRQDIDLKYLATFVGQVEYLSRVP